MSHGARAAEHGKTAPKTGAYVLAKLRELDASLNETAPRVLTDGDDDAIHDLRVAIRRMRTLLKMSRKVFGRWHTDVVRGAFAEVMRATGDLRDEEVLEETLEDAAEGPELDAWLKGREAREAKLRQAVVTRIERGDLDRARLMLKALLVFPVEPERNVDLARFARRTVERARRKVESKRDVDVEDVTGMHDLRIAYKELRYSIELLADALPIDARAQLEPATVFQKRLGELHDVDMATEVVRAAKGLSVAAREQVLASLATLRTKRVHKYLRELDPLGAAERAAEKAAKAMTKALDASADRAGDSGRRPALPSLGAPAATSLDDAPTVHLPRLESGPERRK
ncbi:MAG: CHAD domain-containing protein [Labilithrix sp.]|nr:CHAD domain-containing protein [Labilithrix sp.]